MTQLRLANSSSRCHITCLPLDWEPTVWNLAFHTIALVLIAPAFAKRQASLLYARETALLVI